MEGSEGTTYLSSAASGIRIKLTGAGIDRSSGNGNVGNTDSRINRAGAGVERSATTNARVDFPGSGIERSATTNAGVEFSGSGID